ncbi:hypothetical protein KSS87_017504 [Heliosperma pusillum]|nr:hypothetical protein KSS87_017504 [Heliosperma pusillum]
MGLVSHRVKKEDIRPGDHIYTWRALFTYSHHGIYVGGNKVVHFTDPADGGSKLSTSSTCSGSKSGHPSPCPTFRDCGYRQPESGVVLSCLDCFLGEGSPRLFEYEVAEFSFHIKRPGTCTTAQPDPPETVIHRATYLLQNGFGNYNMLRNNCEDFAIYCKTGLLDKIGLGRSGQVSSVIASVPIAVPFALVAKVIRNPVAAVGVAVGAGLYCMSRHGIDIGVRSDVIKVPVEELPVYFSRRLPFKPSSLPAVDAARVTNLRASVQVTYHCFHWKKGTPFSEDQGIYNRLTWWEQIDNGKQLTRNRKFLTVVPVVLYLIASHTTDYEHPMLFLNTLAVIILVIAKFPHMHKEPRLEGKGKERGLNMEASPHLHGKATITENVEGRLLKRGVRTQGATGGGDNGSFMEGKVMREFVAPDKPQKNFNFGLGMDFPQPREIMGKGGRTGEVDNQRGIEFVYTTCGARNGIGNMAWINDVEVEHGGKIKKQNLRLNLEPESGSPVSALPSASLMAAVSMSPKTTLSLSHPRQIAKPAVLFDAPRSTKEGSPSTMEITVSTQIQEEPSKKASKKAGPPPPYPIQIMIEGMDTLRQVVQSLKEDSQDLKA